MAIPPSTLTPDSAELCSCVLTALTHTLPPYTPSPPAPSYSDQPSCGERSLQHAPGSRFRQRNPASTFVKEFKKATLVLRGQEPNIRTPWYGRDEVISGFVTFENPGRVSQVDILVEGKLNVTTNDGVSKVTNLVNASSTLWKKSSSSSSAEDSCPEQVEFAFTLPESYQSGDNTYPLPPSFQEYDLGGSFLSIRTCYRIRVSVTKPPKNRFSFEKTEHLFLSFDYLPRSRSSDPTTTLPGCLANIKQLPNEWWQVTTAVPVEGQPQLEPIFTNLFIPAARVYPLTEPIPFHVEVSGRRESLRALLQCTSPPESTSPSPAASQPSSPTIPSSTSKRSSTSLVKGKSPASLSLSPGPQQRTRQSCDPTNLKVFIVRQIKVEIKKKKVLKNVIIARGELESVPPLLDICRCGLGDACVTPEYLSWTGTLKPSPDVRTGGFEAEFVRVTDYVALAIGESEVPWMDIKNSVGIKLVTDPWEDPEPEFVLM